MATFTLKDDFFKYLVENALKEQYRAIHDNKAKIVLAHSSSGQKHALSEILQEPGVQAQLSDTKYAMEVKSLEKFYRMMSSDPSRAFYGYAHVVKAAEQGAVETLMLTDALFRLTIFFVTLTLQG